MNKDIRITVDTTKSDEIHVALSRDSETFTAHKALKTHNAQAVLPLIDALLRDHGVKLSQLTHIDVKTGPGSYTGIRVGLSVANMLGTLLGIPVNGKKTLATPTYS